MTPEQILNERSRAVTKSDPIFDLEPGHCADAPRLRRVSNPAEQHPVYWEYCTKSVMPDIVADLVSLGETPAGAPPAPRVALRE